MNPLEIIQKCEKVFRRESVSRQLNILRILSVLFPLKETVDFLKNEVCSENEAVLGEILERMIFIDADEFINFMVEIINEIISKKHELIEKEFNNRRILNILFKELNVALENPEVNHDKIQNIKIIVSNYRNNGIIYNIFRNLYDNPYKINEFYKSLLDDYSKVDIITELDKNIESVEPDFLLNAIIYLKENDEKKRAIKFLEAFSKFEYGMNSHEALDKINNELKYQKKKDEKLVLIFTDSPVTGKSLKKSIDSHIIVELCMETVNKIALSKISNLEPDLILLDKGFNKCKGTDLAKYLRIEKKIEIPIIVLSDFLSEHEKNELSSIRIKDFIQIPFTSEEIRDKVNQSFEKITKDSVINKAKLSLKAGQLLFDEGDPGDCCYIIQNGKIKIWRNDSKGEEITLITIGAGEIFGEMAIIDDENSTRSAAATAVEDSELLRIAEENFDTVLKSNPGFALKMIKIMVNRLRNATNRLKELESKVND